MNNINDEISKNIHEIMTTYNEKFGYVDVFAANVKARLLPDFESIFNENNIHLKEITNIFLKESCRVFKKYYSPKSRFDIDRDEIRQYQGLLTNTRPILYIDNANLTGLVTGLVNSVIRKTGIDNNKKYNSLQEYAFISAVNDVNGNIIIRDRKNDNNVSEMIESTKKQINQKRILELKIISYIYLYFEQFFNIYLRPKL